MFHAIWGEELMWRRNTLGLSLGDVRPSTFHHNVKTVIVSQGGLGQYMITVTRHLFILVPGWCRLSGGSVLGAFQELDGGAGSLGPECMPVVGRCRQ